MNIEHSMDQKLLEMMRERRDYFKKMIDEWMMISAGISSCYTRIFS